MLGRRTEALTAIERAHQLDPNEVGIRRSYAIALLKEGREEDGRRELEEIIRQHPDDREALALLEKVSIR